MLIIPHEKSETEDQVTSRGHKIKSREVGFKPRTSLTIKSPLSVCVCYTLPALRNQSPNLKSNCSAPGMDDSIGGSLPF